MGEQIRVLHVFGALNLGGAESRTVELYRAVDREKVQFDFLVHTDARGADHRDTSSDALMAARAPEHFDEIVKASGARIFAVPRFRGMNRSAYKKTLSRLFAEHRGEWSAVHGHMTSTAAIYLKVAGECGVPLLIAHARSAGVDPGLKGVMTNVLRRPLRKADCPYVRFAVSKAAGEAVFGEDAVCAGDVSVLPNGIRLSRFRYDAAARARIRAQYSIPGDAFVIGHVGNFRYAKNHEHLLRTFAAYRRLFMPSGSGTEGGTAAGHPVVRLLLVGDGERMEEMRTLAAQENLSGDVIFAGQQSEIAAYLQAMDVFVFPSRYEGMPGAVIEAQAAGLPCLIADTITKEADVTPLVRRMPLTEGTERWALALRELSVSAAAGGDALPVAEGATPAAHRKEHIETAGKLLAAAGFDIQTQAERLTSFYLTGVFPHL